MLACDSPRGILVMGTLEYPGLVVVAVPCSRQEQLSHSLPSCSCPVLGGQELGLGSARRSQSAWWDRGVPRMALQSSFVTGSQTESTSNT